MKHVLFACFLSAILGGLLSFKPISNYQRGLDTKLQHITQIELGCGQYNARSGEFENVQAMTELQVDQAMPVMETLSNAVKPHPQHKPRDHK